jgi:glutamyl-tRNA synthetase
VVVDDAAMQITEVVRGEDLLKSAARQLLLIRALGYHRRPAKKVAIGP